MKNQTLAKILYQISEILELQEVEFKPRAYRKAARMIESLSEDIQTIYQKQGLKGLLTLPGIGKGIAEKIIEFLETGAINYYSKLKKETKVNLEELSKVQGLGPKKIKLLYKKLKIKNLKDLEKAIKKQKLRKLEHLGETTEINLSKSIKLIKQGKGRLLLGKTYSLANEIKSYLQNTPGVKRVEIAGSFRRGKETIGDLDFLVISKKPKQVIDAFTSMPEVKQVLAQGTTRSAVRLTNNLNVDLRVLQEKEFGSALQYFTGNKQHNIALRKLALKKKYTLSEYGLFKLPKKTYVAGKTEKEIYAKLGLQYIPPEIRNNAGEIEVALKNKIPKLADKPKAEFHMHSTWSDGINSLSEMAAQAQKLGRKVIAFSDHIGDLGVVNSLEGRRFSQYCTAIDKLNKKSDILILKGAEIDIDKKGNLLATPQMLKKLDVVIGSIHMGFKGTKKEQTNRICKAMEHIDILGHPTTRKINTREELPLNFDRLFETAKQTNTFLEINGTPERMDLKDTYIRKAKEVGCKFSLASDAHSIEDFHNLNYALINARRGWLENKDVLNCWSLGKIKKRFGK